MNQTFVRHAILATCFSLSIQLLAGTVFIAAGAEESSSLDSMWIDQEAPLIDSEPDKSGSGGNPDSISQPSESAKKAAAVASAVGVPSTVAPMCSFDEFRGSDLVVKGLWPGLGPFKASDNDISELQDQQENRIKLNVNSDQVTSAQLRIGKLGSGNVKDLLDIEMAADFLLETLGAKPRKILEFNKQLEKSKDSLKPGAGSLSLQAGRYQVLIDRSKNARPYSCMIAVNSLDANKSILAEHSVKAEDEKPPVESKPETRRPIFDAIKKPLPVKPKTPVAAISPSVDQKKEDFAAAIKSWQQIKKAALKKREVSQLAEILSGKALAKQNTAIQWLQTHGNYYEMEPRACKIEKYTDLGGGKKYSVIAEVREFSKYLRESDHAVLKEADDKYTVNYTLEKINDKWMIVDSAVVKNEQASSSQPAKR